MQRRMIHAGQWIVRGLVGLLAVVGSVYGIWGPPWPTAPEIHPRDTSNGSSLILPFNVQNKSVLFPITDAQMTCGVGWLFVKDARGNKFTSIHTAFNNGAYTFPAGGQPTTYPRDASELVKIEQTDQFRFAALDWDCQCLCTRDSRYDEHPRFSVRV
jgi:hypothetical protein